MEIVEMKPFEDFNITSLAGIKLPKPTKPFLAKNQIEFILHGENGEKRRAVAMALHFEDFPNEGVPEIENFEVADVSGAKEVYVGNFVKLRNPNPGTVIITANFKKPARARLEASKLFVFAK